MNQSMLQLLEFREKTVVISKDMEDEMCFVKDRDKRQVCLVRKKEGDAGKPRWAKEEQPGNRC